MKILAPYLLGGVLISAGGAEIGILAILYALFRDWRFWGVVSGLVSALAFGGID